MQQRIVEEAHKLFLNYGIRSISMDEIALKLGISKKTIYQYFADKDALVDAVFSVEMHQHKANSECFATSCKNAIQEVFMALDSVSEIFKSIHPMVFFDLMKYHPIVFKKFNTHKTDFFFELIKCNLNRGIKEGLYRPEINTDILSKYRVVCIFQILENIQSQECKQPISEIMNETTEHFLFGLATTKGIRLIKKYKQERLK